MKIWPLTVTDNRKALAEQPVAYRKLGIVMMKSRGISKTYALSDCDRRCSSKLLNPYFATKSRRHLNS